MSDNTVKESTAVPVSHINLRAILGIPAVRQVILLIGVAASVAAGFAVVLWSQSPGYATLYSDRDTANVAQVAEAMRSAGYDYKLDTDAGLVLIAAGQLDEARFELASTGLIQGGGASMAMLQDKSSFGVSQFMENVGYQTALEAELARTIASLGVVRDARVHLAIPRQSAFIRDTNSASASVLLELNGAAELDPDQAAAIVNLVSSSIPNLSPSRVKVIDQYAREWSSPDSQEGTALATNQLRYVQRLEEEYKRRIEDLLTPMVGPGRVKAQVNADLDFTVTEETRESFDPAQSVIRSEQVSQEEMRDTTLIAGGVPGAQSNQPPETDDAGSAGTVSASSEPVNRTSSTTRNFEVDRTISRTQQQSGRIQRLSVALLIDSTPLGAETAGSNGVDADRSTLTETEVARFTELAKRAVGFDETRGDTIEVTQAPFRALPQGLPADEPPFWVNPLVMDIAKLVLGAVVALGLGFGLVRPMLKGLLANAGADGSYVGGGPALLASGPHGFGGGQQALNAPSFDDKVKAAKNITNHDPARVAQIVRKWVSDNG
jgi:flagellar M-ring protein FliF